MSLNFVAPRFVSASLGAAFGLALVACGPVCVLAKEEAAAAVPADATAVPADGVDTSFEGLQATIQSLKASGVAINTSLTRCNSYLDTLGTSPVEVAGKDLQAAFSEVPNLKLQDWQSSVTANKPTVSELLLKDSVVRKTMLDIQKEVMRIKADIDRIQPQAKKVSTQATLLGDELKKMIKDKPWQVVSKTPMIMKFGGLVKDGGEVMQVAQRSLIHCGEVVGKLGVATSLLPPTDPLVGELVAAAKVEVVAPPAVVAADAQPLPVAGADKPGVAMATAGSRVSGGGFAGFWQEGRSGGSRVQLLLGAAQAGQVCGFLIVPQLGGERQVALVLGQAETEQQLYTDAKSGGTFKVTAFKDQLILDVGKADGSADTYMLKRL